ncbi:hypothetical protein BJY21_003385 [Kineosphaera limosa]|uniref:hypothetical protein n=1 Tax=Kineosphaera limosa TaxID=111564 RepID=UPI00030176BA|nr:hypothetical protein [Kineosphaera limosa]NYE02201.1 hypothetical protein [Kineosphaera limosa]
MQTLGEQPVVALGTPLPRRALGLVALVGAALGVLALVLPPGLAALALLGLLGLVPGAVTLGVLPAVPRTLAVVAIPALGAALLALVLTAQLGAGLYASALTRWALVGLGVVGGALLLAAKPAVPHAPDATASQTSDVANGDDTEHTHSENTRSAVLLTVIAAVLAAVATACWIVAIPAMRSPEYSSYGLLARAPLLAAGVGACAVAVLLAVRARSWWFAWAALLLLVLARRSYTLLGTDMPLYQWTYRHLGVMDWFAHTGTLARDVDVYNNWPGALALATWLTQTSELSRFDLALAYIVGHHLVLVVAVYALARAAGMTPWAALVAATLVELTDWVGQDYLAPQSLALLLAIVCLAALLVARDPRWRRGGLWVALVVFAGITWVHQLTPVWLLVVLVALTILRVVRPPWVVLAFLAVFAVMVAINLPALLAHSTGLSLDVLANTAGNIASPVSPGQAVTSRVVTVLAVALWLCAGLVAGWNLVRRRAGLVAPVIAFSPLVLLLTGYGGEAIYRVYLYSLPGVALILAPPLAAALFGAWLRASAAVVAVLALAMAALQGSLGGWYTAVFSRADVELAIRLEQAAGPNGVIATPTVGFPRQVTWHYVDQARADTLGDTLWSLQNELATPAGINATPVDRLTQRTQEEMATTPVYVVLTDPMRNYATQYGTLPPAGLNELATLLLDRGWTVLYRADGTSVYANEAGVRAFQSTPPRPLP